MSQHPTPPLTDLELFQGYSQGRLQFAEPSWSLYLKELRNSEGQSLLHVTDHPDSLRALLASGLDPNARCSQGRTPLMRLRRAEGNQLLVEAGADPNAQDPGGNHVLDYQVGSDGTGYCPPDYQALEVLLEAGAQRPDRSQARRWLERARSQITSALEANECRAFEAWLKGITTR